MYLRGWGLATSSFNKYKIAHTLLGGSCTLCFETVLGINKITLTPSPPQRKNFQKIFLF